MKQTALITGASSGIGKELAYLFAKDGYELILVARRKEKLEALAGELREKHGTMSTIIVQDLAAHGAATAVFEKVQDAGKTVDALVNNAGFGTYGKFWENDEQKEIDMIHVNVSVLTHLTHLFLPGMVERKHGQILNIASTAAFQPGPFMSVYFATKAFVLHFTEGIASELEGTDVYASALCPGPTRTEFSTHGDIEASTLFDRKLPSAKDVAEYGYREMKKRQVVIVHGCSNKALLSLNKISPRSLVVKVVKRLQRK